MGGQKLSANASRVLLSLLLTRQSGSQIPKSEFAILAGLTHIAIVGALQELEQNGLISIVAQEVKHEAHMEELGSTAYATITMALVPTERVSVQTGSGFEPLGVKHDVVERPILAVQADVEQVGGEAQITYGRGKEAGGIDSSLGEDKENPDPLEQCRLADESGVRSQKIAALKVVWGGVFPVDQYDYEYAQLSDSFAKELTRGERSAEWVGTIIQRIGEKWWGRHLKSPAGYIRAAVEGEEAKSKVSTPINRVEDDEVDMDLMAEFARAWQAQKGK
jgi:hypothetical protein